MNFNGDPLRGDDYVPGVTEDSVEEVLVPHKDVIKKMGTVILPSILRMIVEKRKLVKQEIKREKNPAKL